MRKYEVLLLLHPNLKEEERSKLLQEVEELLGGNIVQKEEWGIKKLAYQIKKLDEAYYVLYYVETEPQNILSLKEMISLKKTIIRNLILKHEKRWPFEMKSTKDIVFQKKVINRKNQTTNLKKES